MCTRRDSRAAAAADSGNIVYVGTTLAGPRSHRVPGILARRRLRSGLAPRERTFARAPALPHAIFYVHNIRLFAGICAAKEVVVPVRPRPVAVSSEGLFRSRRRSARVWLHHRSAFALRSPPGRRTNTRAPGRMCDGVGGGVRARALNLRKTPSERSRALQSARRLFN